MSTSISRGASRKRSASTTNVRQRPRKKFIPSLFLRVIAIVLFVVVTSAISWAVINRIALPYVEGAQQASIIAEKQSELKTLNLQNDQLARQSAMLTRPDGEEAAARSKGYLKPGESSLVVEPAPSSGQPNQ